VAQRAERQRLVAAPGQGRLAGERDDVVDHLLVALEQPVLDHLAVLDVEDAYRLAGDPLVVAELHRVLDERARVVVRGDRVVELADERALLDPDPVELGVQVEDRRLADVIAGEEVVAGVVHDAAVVDQGREGLHVTGHERVPVPAEEVPLLGVAIGRSRRLLGLLCHVMPL
jgi:hypothetical protein